MPTALGEIVRDARAVVDDVDDEELLVEIVALGAPELVEIELIDTAPVTLDDGFGENVTRADVLAIADTVKETVIDSSADDVGAPETEFVFDGLGVGDAV